ncbi:hypothetical protein BHE74_00042452 [Ensete ventricosum]|nr:hypothetical protein BHE74_00042452 [Ensete ventricosum]
MEVSPLVPSPPWAQKLAQPVTSTQWLTLWSLIILFFTKSNWGVHASPSKDLFSQEESEAQSQGFPGITEASTTTRDGSSAPLVWRLRLILGSAKDSPRTWASTVLRFCLILGNAKDSSRIQVSKVLCLHLVLGSAKDSLGTQASVVLHLQLVLGSTLWASTCLLYS